MPDFGKILCLPGCLFTDEAGKMHAGRVGVSILHQVGLKDWIAASPEEYIDTAVHWSRRPEVLARARMERVGLTRAKAKAIRALARAVVTGKLVLDPSSDPEETARALCRLPGIGEWTAQYVAMRGLKYPDAFPATDLGLIKAAGAAGNANARILKVRAEAWRPWRAYAALQLWNAPAEG